MRKQTGREISLDGNGNRIRDLIPEVPKTEGPEPPRKGDGDDGGDDDFNRRFICPGCGKPSNYAKYGFLTSALCPKCDQFVHAMCLKNTGFLAALFSKPRCPYCGTKIKNAW